MSIKEIINTSELKHFDDKPWLTVLFPKARPFHSKVPEFSIANAICWSLIERLLSEKDYFKTDNKKQFEELLFEQEPTLIKKTISSTFKALGKLEGDYSGDKDLIGVNTE